MSMPLLQTGKIGKYTTKNRVVMAPMTRSRAVGNVVNDLTTLYYKQRSSAGLLLTEATQVSTLGVGYINTPGIHTTEQVRAWNNVTKTVHDNNGLIFNQLWHVGRVSHSSFHNGESPVSASNIGIEGQTYTYEGMKDFSIPRALETKEIISTIKDYRNGAINAMSAEFDGVEIHGANGYLLEQFLTSGSNKRTDEYGGSLENRARLVLNILTEVCDAIGSDKVGIRFSPANIGLGISDENPKETYEYLLDKLNDYNLAYVHLMNPFMPVDNPNYVNNVTEHFRKIYKGTIITNAGFDGEKGNQIIEKGDADFVSYGRLLLANPDLVERFEKGAELNNFDQATFYGGDEKGYTDYPFMK
jgi:N-ethylmaleimide reductase